jgi:hypothetical protein
VKTSNPTCVRLVGMPLNNDEQNALPTYTHILNTHSWLSNNGTGVSSFIAITNEE